jgi:hypothetical protein
MVADAIDCVAKYAEDAKCDWEHWSEMYEKCNLYNAKIDNYLLDIVKKEQCTWSRWTEGIYLPLYRYCNGEDEAEIQPNTDTYIEVTSDNCESFDYETLTSSDECKSAAISLGRTVTWGPHGGYTDVVTGCSARFSTHNTNLFFNQPDICDPSSNMKGWTYTECKCTDWMPCLCRVPNVSKILFSQCLCSK